MLVSMESFWVQFFLVVLYSFQEAVFRYHRLPNFRIEDLLLYVWILLIGGEGLARSSWA